MAVKKKQQADTITAVFCVVKTEKKKAPAPSSALPAAMARLRVLDAGNGLSLVVADAEASTYGVGHLEPKLADVSWVSSLALAHEAVITACLALGTVVPFKLFTLFSSDDAALAAVDRKKIERVVARVAGALEWTFRVTLDDTQAKQALVVKAKQEMATSASSGAAFLVKKKHEQEAKKKLTTDARATAESFFDDVAVYVRDARRRTPAQPDAASKRRVLVDASLLVDAQKEQQFLSVVDARTADLTAAGFDVTCTGPWPVFSFVGDTA